MGDEFGHESAVEIPHPDIDSALKMHFGSDDFCYKTREVDGSTTHLLKKMKKGVWEDYFTIEDEEVKGFDNDEIATFLILKVSMDCVTQRTTGVMFILSFIVGVPVIYFLYLTLGIDDPYTFAGLLIDAVVIVPFIVICCIWSNAAERSVDNQLYSILPNFITVLQKMKDLKEDDFQKKDLEERIHRLLDRYQTRPIE